MENLACERKERIRKTEDQMRMEALKRIPKDVGVVTRVKYSRKVKVRAEGVQQDWQVVRRVRGNHSFVGPVGKCGLDIPNRRQLVRPLLLRQECWAGGGVRSQGQGET